MHRTQVNMLTGEPEEFCGEVASYDSDTEKFFIKYTDKKDAGKCPSEWLSVREVVDSLRDKI